MPGTVVLYAAAAVLLLVTMMPGRVLADEGEQLLGELAEPQATQLEDLVQRGSRRGAMTGFASYYAARFEGRRTTSGLRYNPDKLTAAHSFLPLGTVVRVVNPSNSREVQVVVTDRCRRTAYPFIDLSRAAARMIGLWGKGKQPVVIIPLLEEKLDEQG